jgi:hypothetical protein
MKFVPKNFIPIPRNFKFKHSGQIWFHVTPAKSLKKIEFFSQKSHSPNSNPKIDKIISSSTKVHRKMNENLAREVKKLPVFEFLMIDIKKKNQKRFCMFAYLYFTIL